MNRPLDERHSLLPTLLTLLSALPGQSTYTTFGHSCPGMAPCGGANTNPTPANWSRIDQTYALLVPPTARARAVSGFELFTFPGGPAPRPSTLATFLFAANAAGAPTGAPLRTSSLEVGMVATWVPTTFPTYVLPANTALFVAFAPSGPFESASLPIDAAGTNVPNYERTSPTAVWRGSFRNRAWAWRLLCGTPNGPVLGNTGVPNRGGSFTVDLAGAPGSASCLFALGFSAGYWNSTALPLELSAMGAPGCRLYVAPYLVLPVRASPAGTASVPLFVPVDPRLAGARFYNQFAVADPNANALGLAFTGAGSGFIQ